MLQGIFQKIRRGQWRIGEFITHRGLYPRESRFTGIPIQGNPPSIYFLITPCLRNVGVSRDSRSCDRIFLLTWRTEAALHIACITSETSSQSLSCSPWERSCSKRFCLQPRSQSLSMKLLCTRRTKSGHSVNTCIILNAPIFFLQGHVDYRFTEERWS